MTELPGTESARTESTRVGAGSDALLEIARGASGTPVVARVRGLLTADEAIALRRALLDLEPRFVDASIGGAREDWRIGRVIYDPPPEAEVVVERVGRLALAAAEAFDLRLAAVGSIERQATVYGDGGFYKKHSDSRGPDAMTRVLSWVHYLVLREPKGFTGGQLAIIDDDATEEPPVLVEPEDGLTVIFPSILDHEVLPVRSPSGAYADGRFSVNGWIRR